MGRKSTHENFRVVVEPRSLGDWGWVRTSDSLFTKNEEDRQRQYRERCEEIVADIKRHVDSVGSVYVDHDTVHKCEHCGWAWTEESATYNGGCCDKDQVAEDARLAAAEAQQ